MKTCRRCGEAKPWGEYGRAPRNRDGVQSWCLTCSAENNRAWYKANRERKHAYNRAWWRTPEGQRFQEQRISLEAQRRRAARISQLEEKP